MANEKLEQTQEAEDSDIIRLVENSVGDHFNSYNSEDITEEK
jgi:hypothetical protein